MRRPRSTWSLETLGRERLSRHFWMREFLCSEIGNYHEVSNIPDDPELALERGRGFATTLLDPLEETFGRIFIRSGYRSPRLNAFGNAHALNCARNDHPRQGHVWDLPDRSVTGASIVIPWFAERYAAGPDWRDLAWWLNDHLVYSKIYFFYNALRLQPHLESRAAAAHRQIHRAQGRAAEVRRRARRDTRCTLRRFSDVLRHRLSCLSGAGQWRGPRLACAGHNRETHHGPAQNLFFPPRRRARAGERHVANGRRGMDRRVMMAFDTTYASFPDFLLGATREIWEGRGLTAKTREHFHPDVILRDAGGVMFGAQAMAETAMETLVCLPDRCLLGEDVIWSGHPQVGMLGSQRILSQATHSGDGALGPATGRRLLFREIVDSYAKRDRISDVWRVIDTGAVLRQLEMRAEDLARDRLPGLDPETQPFTPRVDVTGPYTGQGNTNEWGAAFAALLNRVMAGELSVIPEQYDRACHLNYPGGVEGHGLAAADRFWLGLRAALPSARFEIHHVIGMEEPLMPPRAALRWSLTGRHDGWGAFGRPTGADLHVMGISHAEFGPWGLRREWTLYDEVAVWTQIVARTG